MLSWNIYIFIYLLCISKNNFQWKTLPQGFFASLVTSKVVHRSSCASLRYSYAYEDPLIGSFFFWPSNQLFCRASIHQSIHATIHPSIHSSIHRSIHPPIHSSIHQSTHLFIHQSISPSIHLSIHPSIRPSNPFHLIFCLFIHSFTNPSFVVSRSIFFFFVFVRHSFTPPSIHHLDPVSDWPGDYRISKQLLPFPLTKAVQQSCTTFDGTTMWLVRVHSLIPSIHTSIHPSIHSFIHRSACISINQSTYKLIN